jgi:hypothetical protein
MAQERKQVDWDLVERDYRAGLKTLRQIGEEHGITEGAIRKRAKRDQWSRDLESRIQEKAAEKVRKAQVRVPSTQLTPATERETVEQYSDVVAAVDLKQRDDLELALGSTRTLLEELAALSDPQFRERLEWLGEVMDQSGTDEATGREVRDKLNETYRYIIDLSGRVKMAKDIAGTYGIYGPLQRKVYGLDAEKKTTSEVDELLLRIARG